MVYDLETGVTLDNRVFRVYRDRSTFVEVDRTGIQSYLNGPARQDVAIVSATAETVLQMLWDEPSRQTLASIPVDDADKTIDPARPTLFWARIVAADQIGQGANKVDVYRPVALVGGVATHLIGRSELIIIEGLTLNTLTLGFRVATVLR